MLVKNTNLRTENKTTPVSMEKILPPKEVFKTIHHHIRLKPCKIILLLARHLCKEII
jgi:hypothetical protein